MRYISFIFLLVSISLSATEELSSEAAPQNTQAPEQPPSAKLWLERLSYSLNNLNFNTSFVVVKNNQAEPYHWFHGVDDNNLELEIFSTLNGPRRDILRKGNVVSYIEPEVAPYSVESKSISGPIPSIFSGDITSLMSTYEFISVGRSRILGRAAQLVRIVAKEQDRFGYWLWLDQESGLLLKMAIISRNGQLLEQVQFTHLEISDDLVETIQQLQTAELPAVVDTSRFVKSEELSWEVDWLPAGFKEVKSNRHRISSTKQPVEFILFNDGLVDVSVYVAGSREKQRSVEFVMDGATVVLNQVVNGFEVSVVGKIPSNTAKAIADSVRIKANSARP